MTGKQVTELLPGPDERQHYLLVRDIKRVRYHVERSAGVARLFRDARVQQHGIHEQIAAELWPGRQHAPNPVPCAVQVTEGEVRAGARQVHEGREAALAMPSEVPQRVLRPPAEHLDLTEKHVPVQLEQGGRRIGGGRAEEHPGLLRLAGECEQGGTPEGEYTPEPWVRADRGGQGHGAKRALRGQEVCLLDGPDDSGQLQRGRRTEAGLAAKQAVRPQYRVVGMTRAATVAVDARHHREHVGLNAGQPASLGLRQRLVQQ